MGPFISYTQRVKTSYRVYILLSQKVLTLFSFAFSELLSKYVQCEDSTEVVKVQNDWLKDLQAEYTQARKKGARKENIFYDIYDI
jgi:hypothetical protein